MFFMSFDIIQTQTERQTENNENLTQKIQNRHPNSRYSVIQAVATVKL